MNGRVQINPHVLTVARTSPSSSWAVVGILASMAAVVALFIASRQVSRLSKALREPSAKALELVQQAERTTSTVALAVVTPTIRYHSFKAGVRTAWSAWRHPSHRRLPPRPAVSALPSALNTQDDVTRGRRPRLPPTGPPLRTKTGAVSMPTRHAPRRPERLPSFIIATSPLAAIPTTPPRWGRATRCSSCGCGVCPPPPTASPRAC